MTNRMNTLPQRAVPTVDTWRLREDEAGSRALDYLHSWLPHALPTAAPPSMGETILFRDGSSGLDGSARAALRVRSAALRANPGIRVVIGGYTSQLGFTAYAMGIALQRVQAIRDFVRSQGIEPARIDVAIRGAGWFLVERPGRMAGGDREDPSGACLLQIADPEWALWRN